MTKSSQNALIVPHKVAQPRVARVVERPRVRAILEAEAERPITWLHGEPGAGKTVALAELVQGRRPAPLWLQLDAGDADVAVFFEGLATAARRAWPRRRLDLPKLHPEQQEGGIGAYARRFFSALVGRTANNVVVLDDYHHIAEDSRVHEAVVAGAEALGDGGRLLVASRRGPPPSFARARLSGTMRVVGPESLRFDRNELDALVAQRQLQSLPPDKRAAIHELTEGWAAGLALILESRQLDEYEARNLRRETLFGYFMTEVLRTLDEATVRLLLSTAYLPVVDARLAQRLTGDEGAGERLAALQRRALFVMRVMGGEERFRYHDLFRDFLLEECRSRMSPSELRGLQLRSARALIAAGDTESGADLLVDAEAWDDLGQLLLGDAAMAIFSGRFTSLARRLEAMPEEVVQAMPWLGYWQGLAYLLSAPDRSRRVLKPVVESFAQSGDDLGYCLAYSALATAIMAERHDMRHLDALIDTLYARLDAGWTFPHEHAEAHVASAIAIALAFRVPGHPGLAGWQERARELEPLLPTTDLRAVAQMRVGLSAVWSGSFQLAEMSVARMRELLTADEEPSPFQTGAATSVEQYTRLYTEPTACRALRDVGLGDAEHHGVSLWSPTLRLHDCAASLSLGRLEEAEATLELLGPEIQHQTRVERGYYAELRAWQALLRGDPKQALHHAEEGLRIGEAYGARLPVLSSSYAIALASHELGDDECAEMLLDRLLERGGAIRFLTFQTQMARAELRLARGDDRGAIGALRAALELGARIGCYNYLHWRNEAVCPLLVLALREEIEVAYVQEIIRRHELTAEVPHDMADRWPFPLRIRMLGAVDVTGDARRGVVPNGNLTGVRLRMLAELVAAPPGGLPMRRLADRLWPDADGDRAMQSLHTTLHRLRKTLGSEAAIGVEGGFVRFARELCTVDAWRLIDAAADTGASRAAVQTALALYQGPFLDGVDLGPTALAYRERIEEAVRELRHRSC